MCGDGKGRGLEMATPSPSLGARDFRSLPQVRPQPLSAVAMSRLTTGSDSEFESSLSGEELVTKPVGGNYGKQQ